MGYLRGGIGRNRSSVLKKKEESKDEVMPSLQGVPYFSVLSIQLVSHNCRATMSAPPCQLSVTDPYLPLAFLLI